MAKVSMKGVIDMHVHSNPDIRVRAYDDFELMEAGIRVGARAMGLKKIVVTHPEWWIVNMSILAEHLPRLHACLLLPRQDRAHLRPGLRGCHHPRVLLRPLLRRGRHACKRRVLHPP